MATPLARIRNLQGQEQWFPVERITKKYIVVRCCQSGQPFRYRRSDGLALEVPGDEVAFGSIIANLHRLNALASKYGGTWDSKKQGRTHEKN